MKHFNLLAIGILSLLLVGCSYNANEATSVVSSQMASDDIVAPQQLNINYRFVFRALSKGCIL